MTGPSATRFPTTANFSNALKPRLCVHTDSRRQAWRSEQKDAALRLRNILRGAPPNLGLVGTTHGRQLIHAIYLFLGDIVSLEFLGSEAHILLQDALELVDKEAFAAHDARNKNEDSEIGERRKEGSTHRANPATLACVIHAARKGSASEQRSDRE